MPSEVPETEWRGKGRERVTKGARERGRKEEREGEGDGLGYGVISYHYARISHWPIEIQKI